MVPRAGVEPARPYGHYPLKIARLPIPPPGQQGLILYAKGGKFASNFHIRRG